MIQNKKGSRDTDLHEPCNGLWKKNFKTYVKFGAKSSTRKQPVFKVLNKIALKQTGYSISIFFLFPEKQEKGFDTRWQIG